MREVFNKVDPSRRLFLRSLLGGAFVAPMLVSAAKSQPTSVAGKASAKPMFDSDVAGKASAKPMFDGNVAAVRASAKPKIVG
jgi:hypothetical protein